MNKESVSGIDPKESMNIPYHKIPEDQAWRLDIVRGITDVKGEASFEGFTIKELNCILNEICTGSSHIQKQHVALNNIKILPGNNF